MLAAACAKYYSATSLEVQRFSEGNIPFGGGIEVTMEY